MFLAKASTSFPYPRKPTNSQPDKISKNLFAVFSLKHFSMTKKTNLTSQKKMPFETLTAKKSTWTPLEGQYASIDYFIKKCHHEFINIKFNRITKFSNLSKEEWTALINFKNDLVIKAADKDGATVVWRTDLYQQQALRQLSSNTFLSNFLSKNLARKPYSV